MDYVDQYGPVILRDIAPERWPIYIALGSLPWRGRSETAIVGAALTVPGGEIMIAADCELPGHGYAFHARFGGGSDKDSWIDFFRTLTGEPTWIVAARNDGLSEAVATTGRTRSSSPARTISGTRCATLRERTASSRAPERGPLFDEIAVRSATSFTGRSSSTSQRRWRPPAHRGLRGWLDDNEPSSCRSSSSRSNTGAHPRRTGRCGGHG